MKRVLYSVITGERTGVFPTLIRIALTPLGWVYRILITAHQWLYDHRLLRQHRLPCPVISIGNIVAGGTGKTPAAIWVARTLQEAGIRVAILLRGYGRQEGGSVMLVSGTTPLTASGDEAVMIATGLPDVPVWVGKDRYAAGLAAIRSGKVDAIILDDGFQHRKLGRDLDILTVDATQPFGTVRNTNRYSLLPAGTLRQPPSVLNRADVILLTRTDARDFCPDTRNTKSKPRSLGVSSIKSTSRGKSRSSSHPSSDLADSLHVVKQSIKRIAPDVPIAESCHRPIELYQLGDVERVQQLQCLADHRLLAVCGIGNPNAFAETLRRYAPQYLELVAFPDHHQYRPTDLAQIQSRAAEMGATFIVTTQKDEPRLCHLLAQAPTAVGRFEALRFYVLRIELVITAGKEFLTQQLMECVK